MFLRTMVCMSFFRKFLIKDNWRKVFFAVAAAGVLNSPGANGGEVLDRLDVLMSQMVEQGLDAELDGEPVFTGRDSFLPGKMALGFGWLVWAGNEAEAPVFTERLEQYRA